MNEDDHKEQQKKSNARVALLIAMVPVALFIATFFIQR